MAGRLSSWAGLFILVAAAHVLLTYGQQHRRSFVIDYENNRFLKDGEPFQIISGSMHYYRTLPEQWEERLATMKTAGLNTVQTYIEWSSHEPENDHLDFEGRQDFIRFIKIAERLGFFVILRPGPFIDSERDMGGLPYWLLSETNTVRLRSSDERYLKYVDRYFFKLLPPLKPLLYSNGGPVLMLQVENEYGSYEACDFVYTTHLKNAMRRYLGPDALLVVGLSFDFIGLNLTGFLAYSFFNIGMFFSKDVQAEYLLQHPTGVIPVEINDIVFGIHASFATFITVLQCCFYERQDQRVSLPARVLLGVIWTGAVVFGIVTVAGGNPHSPWLTYLYFFSYSKLVITLIKYIPQAYLNFRRKSTVGWSIGNILLDFTGGSLSMLQMFLIAYNYDDWSSLFGNFTKFGLGFISISFDLLFIIQHYVLYRHAPAITETDADEARPMEFIAVKQTED
ncbi:cystinosin homolog [Ixodes scapularis]